MWWRTDHVAQRRARRPINCFDLLRSVTMRRSRPLSARPDVNLSPRGIHTPSASHDGRTHTPRRHEGTVVGSLRAFVSPRCLARDCPRRLHRALCPSWLHDAGQRWPDAGVARFPGMAMVRLSWLKPLVATMAERSGVAAPAAPGAPGRAPLGPQDRSAGIQGAGPAAPAIQPRGAGAAAWITADLPSTEVRIRIGLPRP